MLTPSLEYLKDSYGNLYGHVLNTACDTAVAKVPKNPDINLGQHQMITRKYNENLLLGGAKQASIEWCNTLFNHRLIEKA